MTPSSPHDCLPSPGKPQRSGGWSLTLVAREDRLLLRRHGRAALIFFLLAALPLRSSAESFLDVFLRVTGIAAAPQTRGGCSVEAGEVWIADLARNRRMRLATDGDYRSPIFAPGDANVLAVKGDDLVLIPLNGRAPKVLRSVPGILKLFAYDGEQAGKVVVLLNGGDNQPIPGILTLDRARTLPLRFDADDEPQRAAY